MSPKPARGRKKSGNGGTSATRPRRSSLAPALDAVIAIDATGKITEWNSRAEAIFGWLQKEARGRLLSETIIPPDQRQAHERGLARYLATGDGPLLNRLVEVTAVRRDGAEFPVELSIAPLKSRKGPSFIATVRDITGRRRAEERFRAVVESAPNAMVMINKEGRITLVNAQTEKLFGYTRGELLGRPVEMLVPDRFQGKHPVYRDEFFRNPHSRSMGAGRDLYGLRSDGTEVPIEIGLNPIQTDEGSFVLAAIVDITERKRAEERFRAVVESAPNAMVMINREGRIVMVNAQTEKLFGYTRAQLLEQSVEMLVPDRFRAKHPAFRQDFFTKPQPRSMGAGRDLYGLRKDGKEVPVEIGLNPIKTAEGSFVLAAIVDITERKRAEERFRVTVESAPNAMVMINDEGKIVLVNAQTEKLFGYPREELLGQTIEMLVPNRFRGTHPGFRTGFFHEPHSRPMGAGRDLFGVRKDGSEVPVEIGLNPIKTDEGSFVLAAVVDITERKRAQTALAQKNEEVEAFVYIVSHDLRTPLVNLQGFSKELERSCEDIRDQFRSLKIPEAAEKKLRAILDEDIPGALRFISASTNKFERLINALLGLSRSGRQKYQFELLDLQALVGTTLDSMRQSIEKTKAAVELGRLPKAWGDSTAIGQVFSNLIANALNYLKPGRPGVIQIGGEAQELMNCYWVRDNGVGIPATAQERIFHVFQRFHPEMAPGEGMGLAIIKRVVERHGGKVWVETQEDVGTTFFVTLPRQEPREE
jgi:PAS domain S-box-containing protein